MDSSTRIIRAALLAAAAAALAAAAYLLREKHQEAEAAVQDIQDQLDALDPATRAAVIARLTSDEVKKVRSKLSQRHPTCMVSCCNVIVLREDDLVGHADRPQQEAGDLQHRDREYRERAEHPYGATTGEAQQCRAKQEDA
jgi:hypothetical protein